MSVRAFRAEDGAALAALASAASRGETDFVLNPLWETEADLSAEFERFEVEPEQHVFVAEAAGSHEAIGVSGFLRRPGSPVAARRSVALLNL